MAKPLRVDPAQLHVTADSLTSHAGSFTAAQTQAQSRAGSVALGTSKAAAALPAMLTEWQNSGTRFAEHHVKHADGHRAAAAAYTQTDGGAADGIDAAARGVDAIDP